MTKAHTLYWDKNFAKLNFANHASYLPGSSVPVWYLPHAVTPLSQNTSAILQYTSYVLFIIHSEQYVL